jgi:hypothetical protein
MNGPARILLAQARLEEVEALLSAEQTQWVSDCQNALDLGAAADACARIRETLTQILSDELHDGFEVKGVKLAIVPDPVPNDVRGREAARYTHMTYDLPLIGGPDADG